MVATPIGQPAVNPLEHLSWSSFGYALNQYGPLVVYSEPYKLCAGDPPKPAMLVLARAHELHACSDFLFARIAEDVAELVDSEPTPWTYQWKRRRLFGTLLKQFTRPNDTLLFWAVPYFTLMKPVHQRIDPGLTERATANPQTDAARIQRWPAISFGLQRPLVLRPRQILLTLPPGAAAADVVVYLATRSWHTSRSNVALDGRMLFIGDPGQHRNGDATGRIFVPATHPAYYEEGSTGPCLRTHCLRVARPFKLIGADAVLCDVLGFTFERGSGRTNLIMNHRETFPGFLRHIHPSVLAKVISGRGERLFPS